MANRDPFSTPTHYSNDDFFGNNIPPPHRLSGNFPPSNTSPVNPSSSFAPHDAAARGAYAPAPTNYNPEAATSSAPMTGYQDIDTGAGEQQPYQWQEKSTGNGVAGSRRKMFIIGGIVGLLVIIGVAVGVGVGVANSNKGSTSNRSSSGSPPGTSVSGDPSNFPKDSRLHQVFYGFAYTPEGSQLPNCGNNLTEVIQDIQLLSQLTTRIRLYGADCNQSALVLEAIKQTKVDMQVFLGNYPDPTDGGAAYVRQRDIIIDAIKTYGTDHIAGITVGNEFVLNYLTSQGNSDSALANQAQGNAAAAVLIPNITDTRTQIGALGLSKNIPIGNAEAGAYFNNEILAAVDYGMANVHPWFADVSIDQAASWTFGYFQETDVTPAQAIESNITMYIAETGWPTASDSAAAQTNGPSQANTAGLQEFMNNFVCQANANNTGYFFFEFTDEPWKAAQFGGVEGHWGLFNSDRTLKDVTIPSC